MKQTKYSVEQIINNLRKVELMTAHGKTVEQCCRELGFSEQSYYRWRQKYGGMQISDAKRLKELEAENARLKKLVADLSVDNAILKEVVEGKY